ncbi:WhiB family transcriptional regulator [Mesorhizobium sp. B2-3-3]|nr:WhiB family transcriptional regulator [Mesorhizobium sp. B2-3-3]
MNGDAWREEALCRQTDPELFHPEVGANTVDAKRTCTACPVRRDCLEFALETEQYWGVWGGLSQNELRRRVRIRRAGAAA